MIALTADSTKVRVRKNETQVIGVCSGCGARHKLTREDWAYFRQKGVWPVCGAAQGKDRCKCRVYPVTRHCTRCGAKLRNGNFETRCALCERSVPAMARA